MILKIAAIAAFFALVAFYELPDLVKKKHTRDLWTVSVLLFIGLVLALMFSLGFTVKIPVIPD